MSTASFAVWHDALSNLLGTGLLGSIANSYLHAARLPVRVAGGLLSLSPYLVLSLLLLAGSFRRSLPLLAAALVYLLQIGVYSALMVPIVVDRTLLPALLPMIGFVAVRTTELRWRTARWVVVGLVVLCGVAFAHTWYRSLAHLMLEPWRAVAEVLDKTDAAQGRLLSVGWVRGPSSFYATKPIAAEASIELLSSMSDATVTAEINRAIAEAGPNRPITLVVRNVFAQPASLAWLQATVDKLTAALGPPLETHQFGILSVRVFHTAAPPAE